MSESGRNYHLKHSSITYFGDEYLILCHVNPLIGVNIVCDVSRDLCPAILFCIRGILLENTFAPNRRMDVPFPITEIA